MPNLIRQKLISVAPMMDCTDRHDRYFLRLISKNVMLYSEMVATKSAIHGDRKRILGFREEEKIELNKAWHKLDPWPDSVQGLTLLKENYIISSLSNGNVALLVNMAKYGGLPWDTVLSAELVRHYKPDKETYMSTSEFFGVPIGQVMMVAAHKNDLKSANSYGMKTAYVPRPLEHGSTTVVDTNPEVYIDIVAEDFVDLSNKLSDIRNNS